MKVFEETLSIFCIDHQNNSSDSMINGFGFIVPSEPRSTAACVVFVASDGDRDPNRSPVSLSGSVSLDSEKDLWPHRLKEVRQVESALKTSRHLLLLLLSVSQL